MKKKNAVIVNFEFVNQRKKKKVEIHCTKKSKKKSGNCRNEPYVCGK